MWAARKNVIAGMIHGKVDWVSQQDNEIGLYLRPQDREAAKAPVRCVIRGPEVAKVLANRLVSKGMTLTAHGEFTARAFRRKDDNSPMGELVCKAARIFAETTLDGRFRGSIYATLKGVVMNWDPNYQQVKTFFNAGEDGREDTFTVSLSLRAWIAGMSQDSRARFLDSMRKGREFTTTCLVDVGCYQTKSNVLTASLLLLPTDFRLQG